MPDEYDHLRESADADKKPDHDALQRDYDINTARLNSSHLVRSQHSQARAGGHWLLKKHKETSDHPDWMNTSPDSTSKDKKTGEEFGVAEARRSHIEKQRHG